MMAINIGILLIVVCILIISVCILSYLKMVFERLLNDSAKERSLDFQERTLKSISDLELSIQETQNLLHDCINLTREQNTVQSQCFESGIRSVISEIELQSEKIESALQNISDYNSDIIKSQDVEKYEKVAYDDAVIAFQNVNDAIYSIRKNKSIAHKLLESLYAGESHIDESDYSDFDETTQERIKSVESKLNKFNESYRNAILNALNVLKISWNSCVRFPLNQGFDIEWDENILGEAVDEGTIITRVVSLGYEFPNSVTIGRTKAKVI